MYANCTWDERYKAGKDALPWDTGSPAPELVEYFGRAGYAPKRALEIGCGTGTNAIWMAKQGCQVIATDLSPTAVEAAIEKAKDEDVEVRFETADIIATSPVDNGSVDFVFDRGVFHVMPPDMRQAFIDRVADALEDDGFWLCLAGNADQNRDPDQPGPPQLKASELIDLAEAKFEIYQLDRGSFVMPDGSPHLAWQVLYRKRRQRFNQTF